MSKKLATRNKIIEIALQLFSDNGYHQTTTKQIANEAEINEITLFRHFGSKENLFQVCTESVVTSVHVKDLMNESANKPFDEVVMKISKDYLKFCYDNEKLYKIQMRLTDNEKEFVRLKLSREFEMVLEDYFKDQVDQGKINGDPRIMAVTLIESVLGAFTVFVLTKNTFTDIPLERLVEEHAMQFVDYYVKE